MNKDKKKSIQDHTILYLSTLCVQIMRDKYIC